MVEMTTGQRSFNSYKFDLAVMICNGLRPKFAPGTSDCYVELANQCMNSDPDKWPNNEISKTLPMVTEKLNDIYTSKPYNISAKFSKTAGDIEVPNDI
ncbi:hypothetical protein C2G38_2130306 [Gigaspora rosea]|uniref:Serine-threonine/tyrosine-protein kinase catalytic domain-containing protein n=1 Tax=Gigaspora rosea TaxID=44941 RepID=A0A397TPS5_9GLOM|nr:hypothetical protein C2G38_2130306 [Gigaspora rosea]